MARTPFEAMAVLSRHEPGLASLPVSTWNQLWGWLREMDGLRAVLGSVAASRANYGRVGTTWTLAYELRTSASRG